MRKFLFFLVTGLGCFTCNFLSAQQIPHYHHYFINPMAYNPAATGLFGSTNAFFMRSHRNLGFEGGNIVNVLTVDGSLWKNKLGLGLTLANDELGPSSTSGGYVNASYRVNFTEKIYLRFGVSGGAKDYRVNFSQAIVQDPNDPALLNYTSARKIVPDVSSGLLFGFDGFRLGISAFQLLGNKVDFQGLVNENPLSAEGHTFIRHFMGNAQYDIKAYDKLSLFVSPYASVKYIPGAPFHYEGGLVVDFKKWGWVNGCYKAGYGITAALGVRIFKNAHIGYAYDIVTNSASSYAGLNQEVLLGYMFPVTQSGGPDRSKEIEELEKKNQALQAQLDNRNRQYDSLNTESENQRREAAENYAKMEREYLDSIAVLNDMLKQKPTENPVVNQKDNTEDKNIKRSKDDHFLEMDNSESPQGLYVVYGAFSKFDLADRVLEKVKKDFPSARLIYNERNAYRYIILTYSTERPPVFQTKAKALSQGLEKAWILQYSR